MPALTWPACCHAGASEMLPITQSSRVADAKQGFEVHNEPIFKRRKRKQWKAQPSASIFPAPAGVCGYETEINQWGHLRLSPGPSPVSVWSLAHHPVQSLPVRWFHSPQAQTRVSPRLRMGWRRSGGGQLLAEAPGRKWVGQHGCSPSLLCPLPCTHECCPQTALSRFP